MAIAIPYYSCHNIQQVGQQGAVSGLHSHYGTDKFDLVKNLVIGIPASSRRLETQPILTQNLPILTFCLSLGEILTNFPFFMSGGLTSGTLLRFRRNIHQPMQKPAIHLCREMQFIHTDTAFDRFI